MIRVAIKASSPVTQAGLERLLQDDADVELVPLADGSMADVVIVEAEGPEIASELLEDSPLVGPPVILLLDDAPHTGVGAILKTGVKGLLPRSSSAAEILAGVHAVAEGLVVLDSSLGESLAESTTVRPAAGDEFQEPLTPREAEVLRLLAEGLGNKEIASYLNISEHTAKFHVASILGKLGATTRTEAVTLGIRYGLIMI